jgi:hypothetical protein
MRPSLIAATLLLLAAGSAAAAPLVDGELALDGALLAQAGYPPPAYPPPAYPPPAYPPPAYPPPAYPPPAYPPPAYPPPQQPYYYQPAPRPTIVTKMTPNWGLFAAGMGVWGAAWIIDMVSTYAADHSPFWESAVPIAGPLIQINDNFTNTWDALAKIGLVTDFIFQIGGLTMAVLGISIWHRVAVRAETPRAPGVQLAVTRGPSGHGGGLALTF